jgi:1-acyl-sn-glycerol-3-phosphate acyltransferase
MTLLPTAYALWRTLRVSVPVLVASARGNLTVAKCDEWLHAWSGDLMRAAEVQLSVRGIEEIPRDRAYVVMSNHQSQFDIPLIFQSWPGSLRMVAKRELFRVPVWGPAMKQAGFVSVDRSGDRAQAETAMREAGDAIARGTSIWIAPEGTRSQDGTVAKFKKGGFLLAQTTGAYIVPLAIDGSRHILPKHSRTIRKGVHVTMSYAPPIDPRGRSLDQLITEVRGAIVARLSK